MEHGSTEPGVRAIEEAIKQILVSRLRVDPAALEGVGSTTPLLGRGIGLDSMEALALAVEIEERYDIAIEDGELTAELFSSLGRVAAFVAQRLGAARDP